MDLRQYEYQQRQRDEKLRKVVFVIALVVVALLFFIGSVQGQNVCIERIKYRNVDGVIKIRPCSPIRLKTHANNKDTACIGIYADSLKNGFYNIRLVVWFTREYPVSNIKMELSFPNNGFEVIKPVIIEPENNYAEFILSIEQIEKLKRCRFDYIGIDTDVAKHVWTNIKYNDSQYFCNFLKQMR